MRTPRRSSTRLRCRSRRTWRMDSVTTRTPAPKPFCGGRGRARRRIHRRRDRARRRPHLRIRLVRPAGQGCGEGGAVVALSVRAHRQSGEPDQRTSGPAGHDSAPRRLCRGGGRCPVRSRPQDAGGNRCGRSCGGAQAGERRHGPVGTFVLARRARKPGREAREPGLIARARRLRRVPSGRAGGQAAKGTFDFARNAVPYAEINAMFKR